MKCGPGFYGELRWTGSNVGLLPHEIHSHARPGEVALGQ